MKLYTDPRAPSPRRVHLLMKARGIELQWVRIDLGQQEQLAPEFLERNPQGTVPVLELDDGTHLTEVVAICRYLDETASGTPLCGTTPEERARIADADHWVEMQGLLAVMEGFRNASPGMRKRALPGPEVFEQIPELAERGKHRFQRFLDALEERLSRRPWLAGSAFSAADITAWITLEFAGWGLRQQPDAGHTAILDWQDRVAARLEPADDGSG